MQLSATDKCRKCSNVNEPLEGYYFQTQYKNKDKNFRCSKKITEKCRGSVTLSPNETIVRKRFQTCSGLCKVEDKILEEVHEYEETDRNFKINGHTYHFTTEPKTGNKYFRCIYTNTKKR